MAFKKGESGNPGGRPKENDELKALAREYTAEAIERIAFWMRTEEARTSLAAAMALLDRGYGKPTQATEVSGPDGAPLTSGVDMEVARSVAFLLVQAANSTKEST